MTLLFAKQVILANQLQYVWPFSNVCLMWLPQKSSRLVCVLLYHAVE